MRELAYLCVHWLCAWYRWKQEECVRFSRPVPLCWGKSSSAAQAVTYDVSQTFLRRISKFLLLPPEGWDSRCEPIPLPKYFFKELFRAMLAIHHFSHSRDSWWLLDNRCLYFFLSERRQRPIGVYRWIPSHTLQGRLRVEVWRRWRNQTSLLICLG